jgi:LysR family nitrogen assimilation transcriptional regulator
MDLRQFRCFAAVVERGTVTGAAANLRLAQSAVSRHIRALEHEMGVPLLERWRGGMTPTEAGLTLYERVKAILSALGSIKDEVGAAGRILTGRVRFSAPSSIAELLFPALSLQMKEKHPSVQLSFSELVTEAAVRAIRSDGLDVAVVTSLGQTEGLQLDPSYEEPLCYVQRAAKATAEFRKRTLGGSLIMPRDAGWRRQLQLDPSATIIEVDSMRPMAAMVRLGLGSALMPMVVTRYLVEGDLRADPIPGIKLRRLLAWSAERRLSRAAAAFLDICRPKVAEIGALSQSKRRRRPRQTGVACRR